MKNLQRGVAIVEFALILPLLLVLTFIVTEYGRAVYQYNILTKSVRDGVRYLSVQTPGDATTMEQARRLIVFGNTTGSGEPLAPDLTLDHVSAPTWQTAGTNPVINTVRVEVTGYSFRSMFASTVFGIAFGDIEFPAISATMRSHL